MSRNAPSEPMSRRDAMAVADSLLMRFGSQNDPTIHRRMLDDVRSIVGAVGRDWDEMLIDPTDARLDSTFERIETRLQPLHKAAAKSLHTLGTPELKGRLNALGFDANFGAFLSRLNLLVKNGSADQAQLQLQTFVGGLSAGVVSMFAASNVQHAMTKLMATVSASLVLEFDGAEIWAGYQNASLLGEHADLMGSHGPFGAWIERIYGGEDELDMEDRIGNPFWVPKPGATVARLPEGFQYHPEALQLPILWGYGELLSTCEVMSWDSSLRHRASRLLEVAADGQIEPFLDAFPDFLFSWAGITGQFSLRPGAANLRKQIAFMERIHAERLTERRIVPLLSAENVDPSVAEAVQEAFGVLVEKLAARFLAQCAAVSAFRSSSDVETLQASIDAHPLRGLSLLWHDHVGPDDRTLSGSLPAVLEGLVAAINDGTLTIPAAARVLGLLRHDLVTGLGFHTQCLAIAQNMPIDEIEQATKCLSPKAATIFARTVASNDASGPSNSSTLEWNRAAQEHHDDAVFAFSVDLWARSGGDQVALKLSAHTSELLSQFRRF